MDPDRTPHPEGMQRARLARTRVVAVITVIACLAFIASMALSPFGLLRAEDAVHSVSGGIGTISNSWEDGDNGDRDCSILLVNANATYESGICWQYGGVVPPYYGAFAERYDLPLHLCSIVLDFSQTGNQSGQTIDAYVWDSSGDEPGAVLCMTTDVDPGPVSFWPSLSRHLVDVSGCDVTDEFWVGYWGNWPDEACAFFVGTDTDGFGGRPYTNIAPGLGFPTGWQTVSVAWGPMQAIGIGVEGDPIAALTGACCYPDGDCRLLAETSCDGEYQGAGTKCDPNPCPQPPSGACCIDLAGSCVYVDRFECADLQGAYLGDGFSCDPNPCPQAEGACCLASGTCLLMTFDLCAGSEGEFEGALTGCDPNPCPSPFGACCLPDGTCQHTWQAVCSASSGEFLGEEVDCAPGLCSGPCPGDRVSRSGRSLPRPDYDPFTSGTRVEPGTSTGIHSNLALGPNTNGVLLLHANPELSYSEGADYCGSSGLASCDAAITRADSEIATVIHLLAAFPETTNPRVAGVAFGIYHAECVAIVDWSACADFELPSNDWPDPESGTAVTWSNAQVSQLFEIYWFAVYGYAAEPGALTLVQHPTQGAVFADDSIPAVIDPVTGLGAFGFYREGILPCFEDAPALGACCLAPSGACFLVTRDACEHAEGVYLGDDAECDPNPCPQPALGACCFSPSECELHSRYDCAVAEGTFLGEGIGCDPNPCAEPVGACCIDGHCVVTSGPSCGKLSGEYQGDYVPCEPDPCGITPTVETSWGKIKSQYRWTRR